MPSETGKAAVSLCTVTSNKCRAGSTGPDPTIHSYLGRQIENTRDLLAAAWGRWVNCPYARTRVLAGLAVVELDDLLARRFLQGQRLRLNGAGTSRAAPASGTRVRVYTAGRLLGTAVLEDGLLVPQRLIGTVSEPPPSAATSPLQSDIQP